MAEEKVTPERTNTDTQSRPRRRAVPPPDNPMLRHSDFTLVRRDSAEAARKRIEAWRQTRDMPKAEE